MKKITNKFLPILGLFGLLFITSCGEDDGPTAALPSVAVSASVDGSAILSGDDVTVGSAVSFTIGMTAPGGINGLDVSGQSFSRADLQVEAGETSATANITASALLESSIGSTVDYTFQLVDDLGQVSETVTFSVSVIAAATPVTTHTQTLIGGQLNATTGSFYNAVDDAVYSYADMRDNNSANTDFLFFYGNTNMYTIAAITDADAAIAFDAAIGENSLSAETIATRNETRFKSLTMTAAEFDAITTNEQLLTAYGEVAADATKMNGLAADNVFAFALADSRGSRTGLVKVISTDGSEGSTRAIQIQVKIVSAE